MPPPTAKLYAATAGTTTFPVSTSWSATDPSGVKGMYLDRQTNAGAFARILTATLATSFTEALADGSSYRYHAYATDTLGNVCSGAYGPTFRPSRVEQTSTAVIYAGSWSGTMASRPAPGGGY